MVHHIHISGIFLHSIAETILHFSNYISIYPPGANPGAGKGRGTNMILSCRWLGRADSLVTCCMF